MPLPIPPEPPVTSTRRPCSSPSGIPFDIAMTLPAADRENEHALACAAACGDERRAVADQADRGPRVPPGARDELRDEPRCHLEDAARQQALADPGRRSRDQRRLEC